MEILSEEMASKDDPIYKEGVTITSHKKSKKYVKDSNEEVKTIDIKQEENEKEIAIRRTSYKEIELDTVKIFGFIMLLIFAGAMINSINGVNWLVIFLVMSIMLSFPIVYDSSSGDVTPNTKHSLYTALTLTLSTITSLFISSREDGQKWVSSGALNPVEYEGYAITFEQYIDFNISTADIVLGVITLTTILFLLLWHYGKIIVFIKAPDDTFYI